MSLAYSALEPTVEEMRRNQIIKAAIMTIAELGYMNTTLLQIAKRGQVSAALISHYFQDKNGLMQEVFRSLVWRVRHSTLVRLTCASTPHERIDAVIDANLTPEEFDHNSSIVWLAFWGQVIHVPEFRRIQMIYQARMLSTLSHALRDLIPAADVRETAIAIAALIDGVWLRSTLSAGHEKDGSTARFTVKHLANIILASKTKGASVTYAPTPPASPVRLKRATEADVAEAVTAGQAGQKVWMGLSGVDRSGIFSRAAGLVRAQSTALARVQARETGRAMRIIEQTDILTGADWLDGLATLAMMLSPSQGAGTLAPARRAPLGLVAETGGGGYPFLAACRCAASALACGNASLFNSAMHAPLTVMELARIFQAAGLPDGVLTILHGDEKLARSLRQHDALRLPLPGDASPCMREKSPVLLVLQDADVEIVAREILNAVLRPDGQYGILVFAARALKVELLLKLQQGIEALAIGDPLDERTELGRLESREAWKIFRASLKDIAKTGAVLVAGGQRLTQAMPEDGYFVAPALVSMEFARFQAIHPRGDGPLICLVDFQDEDEIVTSLGARYTDETVCIFTRRLAQAQAIAFRLPVGTCLINRVYPGAAMDARPAPLFGFDSGPFQAVLARYTRLKTIYLPTV